MTVGAGAQITDLTVNDHACLTFGEPEELSDLTAAYLRDGLADGLKVVWVSQTGLDRAVAELARRGIAVELAIAAGQIAAAQCEDRLLSGQAFSTVNMSGLTFTDASCARMILDAARGIPAPRRVVLECDPGIAARFVLLGAGEITGLSLVTVHVR